VKTLLFGFLLDVFRGGEYLLYQFCRWLAPSSRAAV
jgi:hypothetical protein